MLPSCTMIPHLIATPPPATQSHNSPPATQTRYNSQPHASQLQYDSPPNCDPPPATQSHNSPPATQTRYNSQPHASQLQYDSPPNCDPSPATQSHNSPPATQTRYNSQPHASQLQYDSPPNCDPPPATRSHNSPPATQTRYNSQPHASQLQYDSPPNYNSPYSTQSQKNDALVFPNDLVSNEDVLLRYPKLNTLCKVGSLATKLAREAYFGKKMMSKCMSFRRPSPFVLLLYVRYRVSPSLACHFLVAYEWSLWCDIFSKTSRPQFCLSSALLREERVQFCTLRGLHWRSR